mmetsp:Transcript_7113/g.17657  ORF Transcript_7113/g.17657 Transcript_7113/m.17657 type:complete len:383 (+) Transcript_7113:505-1653(+)
MGQHGVLEYQDGLVGPFQCILRRERRLRTGLDGIFLVGRAMLMLMTMMIRRVPLIIPPLSSEVSNGKVQRTAPVRVGHRRGTRIRPHERVDYLRRRAAFGGEVERRPTSRVVVVRGTGRDAPSMPQRLEQRLHDVGGGTASAYVVQDVLADVRRAMGAAVAFCGRGRLDRFEAFLEEGGLDDGGGRRGLLPGEGSAIAVARAVGGSTGGGGGGRRGLSVELRPLPSERRRPWLLPLPRRDLGNVVRELVVRYQLPHGIPVAPLGQLFDALAKPGFGERLAPPSAHDEGGEFTEPGEPARSELPTAAAPPLPGSDIALLACGRVVVIEGGYRRKLGRLRDRDVVRCRRSMLREAVLLYRSADGAAAALPRKDGGVSHDVGVLQ